MGQCGWVNKNAIHISSILFKSFFYFSPSFFQFHFSHVEPYLFDDIKFGYVTELFNFAQGTKAGYRDSGWGGQTLINGACNK
jgi:hypothetical protein